MADSNDDLLEDGDLSETNFEELDLAEEDALLADDGDDLKPIKSSRNEGEKMSQEDDDYLELGVDEDLTLNDEEVVENGNNKKKRIPIAFHDNDDSDDNNSGGERTRFKSERQIIARSSSAIPETLDAVAVRNPVKLNRGGNRGGKGRGGGGKKYGRHQPTNIHVNPHFRPRMPVGGPQMWNSGYHGPPQPPPFQPTHPPYGYQPPHVQGNQWNDQGYYVTPGPPTYSQPPMDMNNYYNAGQDQFYPPQPPPGGYPPQSMPPQPPQMGWDPNYYQGGPPQNFGPPGFQHSPGPQMMPPRMRPPYNPGPRPIYNNKNQNKHFVAKHHQQSGQGWSSNRHQKRDQYHHMGKMPPSKQLKFDNSSAHRVRSNLQEIKMVDCLPVEALAVEEDEEMKAYRKKIEEQKKLREQILKQKEEKRMVAAQQKQQESGVTTTVTVGTSTPTSSDGPPGVGDESAKKLEYKTVRVRTSDGKTIFKKMTLAEIKKLKKIKKIKKISPLHKINPSGVSVKAPSPQIQSKVVAVENLSASTTQKQLEEMAGQVGCVEARPIIWDKSLHGYRNRIKIKTTWKEVCSELKNLDQMGDAEKKLLVSGTIVKEQWKIREHHQKALRKQKTKSGQQASRSPKPWIYQQQMKFLLLCMNSTHIASNISSSILETLAMHDTNEEYAYPVSEVLELDVLLNKNSGIGRNKKVK